jgi:hypothetical protein
MFQMNLAVTGMGVPNGNDSVDLPALNEFDVYCFKV